MVLVFSSAYGRGKDADMPCERQLREQAVFILERRIWGRRIVFSY